MVDEKGVAPDDSRNDLADDVSELGEAWRQFARENAAMTAPPELEARVLAAWEALQHPERRSHSPSRRPLSWAVGVIAVAGVLVAVFALPGDRATPVRGTPVSRADVSAIRNARDVPRPPAAAET